jgi:hypothetical protein
MKMAVALLVASIFLAVKLPLSFGIMLGVYLLSTVLYSLYLKTKVILDICTLAGLYTIRLFAGGAATGIPISEWTAAFAMFCFLGLAAVKRYSELQASPETGELTTRRGYERVDKSTIQVLGLSSMVISVLVLVLYLRSPEVTLLYRHWEMLRLICPVLLYWFGRIWIVAGRGRMHSDPIIFALRDRASLITAAVIVPSDSHPDNQVRILRPCCLLYSRLMVGCRAEWRISSLPCTGLHPEHIQHNLYNCSYPGIGRSNRRAPVANRSQTSDNAVAGCDDLRRWLFVLVVPGPAGDPQGPPSHPVHRRSGIHCSCALVRRGLAKDRIQRSA